MPAAQQQGGESAASAFGERGAVIAPFQLDPESLQGSIELAERRSSRLGQNLPALGEEVSGTPEFSFGKCKYVLAGASIAPDDARKRHVREEMPALDP